MSTATNIHNADAIAVLYIEARSVLNCRDYDSMTIESGNDQVTLFGTPGSIERWRLAFERPAFTRIDDSDSVVESQNE